MKKENLYNDFYNSEQEEELSWYSNIKIILSFILLGIVFLVFLEFEIGYLNPESSPNEIIVITDQDFKSHVITEGFYIGTKGHVYHYQKAFHFDFNTQVLFLNLNDCILKVFVNYTIPNDKTSIVDIHNNLQMPIRKSSFPNERFNEIIRFYLNSNLHTEALDKKHISSKEIDIKNFDLQKILSKTQKELKENNIPITITNIALSDESDRDK